MTAATDLVIPPGALVPGGAGWKAIGRAPTIYGYYYTDKLGLNGPVKVLVIKKDSRGTFTLQVTVVGKLGPEIHC